MTSALPGFTLFSEDLVHLNDNIDNIESILSTPNPRNLETRVFFIISQGQKKALIEIFLRANPSLCLHEKCHGSNEISFFKI